jgi:hypothetical protein
MKWKVWIHSLIAAAIGGAVASLGDILVSPASFPDTKAGWAHLGTVAAFGAIVPVLALLRKTPLGDDSGSSDKSKTLPLVLLLALLLPMGLTGCRPVTASAPPVVVPGQLNDFDGQTWRALLAAHEFANSAVDNAAHLTQAEKLALNRFVAAVNAADVLYVGYHAGTETQQKMQAAMDNIKTAQANYANATIGGK